MGLAALFCFFNWRISRGIVLGMVFFHLYFYLLSSSLNQAIMAGKRNIGFTILSAVGRMVAMALPLLIGILLPQYFNVFGCLAGFVLFKVAALATAMIKK